MFTSNDVDDLLVGPLEAWRLSHLNLSTNPPPLVALLHRLAPVTLFELCRQCKSGNTFISPEKSDSFRWAACFDHNDMFCLVYQISIQKVKMLPGRPSTPKKTSSGGIHPSGNSGLSSWCFAKSQRGRLYAIHTVRNGDVEEPSNASVYNMINA